ncbi:MAG: alpha/beta fold hydrolase [Bacteroidota bacterium]
MLRLLFVLVLSLAACHTVAAVPQAPDSPLTLTEETVTWDNGQSVTFDLGTLTVPVNRRAGSNETITVEVVRFRRAASAPSDVPPVFRLRGGPGWPGVTSDLDDPIHYQFNVERLIETTDVVYVGQRGFGTSTDTPCADREALSFDASDAQRQQALLDALRACRQSYEAGGLDLTGFNVLEAAADVAEAARELGYDQIQLYGSSFGSHVGMALLRANPDLIARVMFYGLEGPDHTHDDPDGLERALESIAAAAESSETLAPYVPPGGLLNAYRDLIRRADAEPIRVPTVHPDTGDSLVVVLAGDDFRELSRGVTRGLAWNYLTPAWALDLLTMLSGDFEPAARRIFRLRTRTGMRNAAFYQLDCGSGITEARDARYRAADGADLVGEIWTMYSVGCLPWDADLGDGFRSDFVTDIPALLLHGTWDVSTPYENATELLPSFRDHHLVTVEGGSHGAVYEAMEVDQAFEDGLYRWFATGDATGLPDRVVLPPPAWQAPAEG